VCIQLWRIGISYSIQHTAYSIQHTAYSIQQTAYSTQHTALSTQHSAYTMEVPKAERKRRLEEEGDSEPEPEPAEEAEAEAVQEVKEPAPVSSSAGKKEAKPLPAGYVCKACGVVDAHAIYDCPLKIKKTKGVKEVVKEKEVEKEKEGEEVVGEEVVGEEGVESKKVHKKLKTESAETEKEAKEGGPGVGDVVVVNAEANALTVFVSGLPFRIKRHQLIDIFQKEGFAKDVHGKDCRLVMFEDAPVRNPVFLWVLYIFTLLVVGFYTVCCFLLLVIAVYCVGCAREGL
jgi:hypothetical protein